MKYKLEHHFSIRRVYKTTDDEYILALKIYNETIPFEIRTESNEITYWLSANSGNTDFELYIFILYLDDQMIGLSMTTYIKKTKIVVDEYLAVLEQYRINTIFLIYLSLIQSYYKENNIDFSYYVTEISNKNNGKNINKESQISLKVLCMEEFGKINAQYYALPLGLDNHESNFEAFLYLKTNDLVKSISKETYLQIVHAIYYDYSCRWYTKFLSEDELSHYMQEVNRNYKMITQQVKDSKERDIQITNQNCSISGTLNDLERTSGTIPVIKKHNYNLTIMIIMSICVLPFAFIVGYSKILTLFGIPISETKTIIGSIISAMITSLTTLYISNKK